MALATEPPRTRFISPEEEEIVYAAKANVVALHLDDETIAMIEIVSPGNQGSQIALQQFVAKSLEVLNRGIHLLVVDLFAPTRRIPKVSTPRSGPASTPNHSPSPPTSGSLSPRT